jgi:hypothetical protein
MTRPLNQGRGAQVRFDLLGLLLGDRVRLSEHAVVQLLREYQLRSATIRGFVLVAGSHLIRLSDEDGWWAERLPFAASVAEEPGHRHSLMPLQLSQGDVLVCVGCGSEW